MASVPLLNQMALQTMISRSIKLVLLILACCVSAGADWCALLKTHTDNTNARVKLSREDLGDTEYYAQLEKLRIESAEVGTDLVALIDETELTNPVRAYALDLVLTDKYSGESSFDAADRLIESNLTEDQLAQMSRSMAFGYPGPSPASESALQKIIESTSSDELKSLSKLCLARILRKGMEDATSVQRLPVRRYHVLKELGTGYAARMLMLESEKLRPRILELLNSAGQAR